MIAELDELSDDAAQMGAVNTVVFTATGAVGHNTDWPGRVPDPERMLRRFAVISGHETEASPTVEGVAEN